MNILQLTTGDNVCSEIWENFFNCCLAEDDIEFENFDDSKWHEYFSEKVKPYGAVILRNVSSMTYYLQFTSEEEYIAFVMRWS